MVLKPRVCSDDQCVVWSRLVRVAPGGGVGGEEQVAYKVKGKLQNTNYYGGCDNPMYVCG